MATIETNSSGRPKAGMSRVGVSALVGLATGALFAGWNPETRQYDHTGYISLKAGAKESGTVSSFESGTNWEDGNAPTPGQSYFVPSGASLRMLNSCQKPFLGDILATAGGSTWQGATACVPVYHLLSGASFDLYNTTETFTNGVWTLYPTDASKHVKMNWSATGSLRAGIVFKDITLRGDADTALEIYGARGTSSFITSALTLSGATDFSGFFGRLFFSVNDSTAQYFRLIPPPSGAFAFPGTLQLGANGVLELTNATDVAGSPVTLGNLELASGAKIELELKDSAVRQLTVTGTLTHADAQARLNVPSRRTRENLNGEGSVTLLTTIAPVSVVPFRMTVQDETVETPRFGTDDFALSSYAYYTHGLPTATWSVRRADGFDNLTLDIKGIVRKNSISGGGDYDSALTNAAYWSDNLAPHRGWDYFANSAISIPQGGAAEWTFGGDSLTLGCKANTRGSLSFRTNTTRFTVDRLACESGASIISYSMKDVHLVASRLDTYAGAYGDIYFQAYNGTRLTLDCEITGDADLFCRFHANKSYGRFVRGSITLSGINTNFVGRVKLGCESYLNQSANEYSSSETERIEVTVGDGRALGGDLSAFTYDGIRIRDWALLNITNTTEFAAVNRGVFVDWIGAIGVASGQTATVRAPVTFGGKLQKQGKGALVFGGSAPQFAVGATDNYTLQATPLAGTNDLYVKEGTIGVAACDALNGVALAFAKGSGLTVDYAATGDLLSYGLRDTSWSTPVSWDADVETIPVDVANLPDCVEGVRTLGVLTVPSDQADAILAKLRFAKRPGIAGRFQKVENGDDGTATISLSVGSFGLFLLIR